MRIGSDDEATEAYYLVDGFRVEWEYEGDRKEAIARITQALRARYAKGRADGQREAA